MTIYFLQFYAKKTCTLKINNSLYEIKINGILYKLLFEPDLKTININKKDYTINNIDEFFSDVKIFRYGEPIEDNSSYNNIVYSFDRNYFSGGFASMYSVIWNSKDIMKIIN